MMYKPDKVRNNREKEIIIANLLQDNYRRKGDNFKKLSENKLVTAVIATSNQKTVSHRMNFATSDYYN